MKPETCGTSTPPAAPWNSRASTSHSWSCAAPASALATVNRASPARKTARLLRASPSRPAGTSTRPKASA